MGKHFHAVHLKNKAGEVLAEFKYASDSILDDRGAQEKFNHIESIFSGYAVQYELPGTTISEHDCSNTVGYV